MIPEEQWLILVVPVPPVAERDPLVRVRRISPPLRVSIKARAVAPLPDTREIAVSVAVRLKLLEPVARRAFEVVPVPAVRFSSPPF